MKKKNTNNDLGFKVPQGYFESSADRLFDKVSGLQEQPAHPFSVPVGYFEGLEDRILKNIESNENQQSENNQPFEVPQGYFESLEDRVLKNVASHVSTVEKVPTGFTVPGGYFEATELKILQSTVDKPVVQLERDYPAWVLPMIAVAAIFVAILAIDGFWNSNTISLDDLDNEDIAIYLAETNFSSGHDDAVNILYGNADELNQIDFETKIDNDALLDYLEDEIEMNLMIEE